MVNPYLCNDFINMECEKPYCICNPDASSSSFVTKCPNASQGMPDCYLVLLNQRGVVIESMLVECKCNLERGSRSIKEPRKLFSEIARKFANAQRLYHAKEKVVAVSRDNKGVIAMKLRESRYDWAVKDCDEICGVCKICS